MKVGSDLVRWIFWVVVQLSGFLCDNLFEFTKTIALIDITKIKLGDNFIFNFWSDVVFKLFLFAVVVRSFIIYLKFINQDPTKITQQNFIKRIIFFMVMIFIINQLPLLFESTGKINNQIISNVNYFAGIREDIKLSTIIVSAGNAIENDAESKLEIDNKGVTKLITMKEISINDTGGGVNNWWIIRDFNGYTYFPGTWQLMFTMLVMVYSCIIMVSITLDVGKRIFELLALFLFSFLPISAMWYNTEPFSKWFKQVFGIYLSNFATIWLLLATLITVSWIQVNYSIFFSLIMFVAGLLFSMNGSQTIARLMGIETSGGSLGQIAQMSQALNPFVAGASNLANGTLKTLGGLTSNATKIATPLLANGIGMVGSGAYSKIMNNSKMRDVIEGQRVKGSRDYLYKSGTFADNLRKKASNRGGFANTLAEALENRYEKSLAKKSYRNGGLI